MSFFSLFAVVILSVAGATWFAQKNFNIIEESMNYSSNYSSIYHSRKVESVQNHPVTGLAELKIQNINGPIFITGHKHNSIKVTVTKIGNKNHFNRIHANVHFAGNKGTISTTFDDKFTHQNASIEYQIEVPHNTQLDEVKSSNGAITIKNVTGPIEVTTHNGKLTLHGIANTLEAKTFNGMIEATITKLPSNAEVALKTSNGAIRCSLDQTVKAQIEAETFNGKVHSDFTATSRSKTTTTNTIKAVIGKNPTAKIELETKNGAIHLLQSN
jgi:hypothetical protein